MKVNRVEVPVNIQYHGDGQPNGFTKVDIECTIPSEFLGDSANDQIFAIFVPCDTLAIKKHGESLVIIKDPDIDDDKFLETLQESWESGRVQRKESVALPTWNSIMDYMTTTIEQLRESGLLHDEGEGGILIMPNGMEMAVVKWHLTACSLFIETLAQLCHLNHPIMVADGWFNTVEGCRFHPLFAAAREERVSTVSNNDRMDDD